MTEIESITNEILRALVTAPAERKSAALRILRGEVEATTKPVIGPLLMGMGAGAKFLGVSRVTLYRVCRAGRIQKVELYPGSYRVRREDLEALAAAGPIVGRTAEVERGHPPSHEASAVAQRAMADKTADKGGAGVAGAGREGERGQRSEGSGQLGQKAVVRSQNSGDGAESNARFLELKALADEGNEEAAADLFKEFGYDHAAGRFVEDRTRLLPSSGQAHGTNGAEAGA